MKWLSWTVQRLLIVEEYICHEEAGASMYMVTVLHMSALSFMSFLWQQNKVAPCLFTLMSNEVVKW